MSDYIPDRQYEWKENLLWWQKRGLMYTATGYGNKIPSRWMIKYEGKWRRVYIVIWSNAGSAYIMRGKSRLFIHDYQFPGN